MDRTPSPPRRLRTPSAPLHGDDYEPYSPRRSTRVAAQRDTHVHLHRETIGTISPRARRDVTPTATYKRKATARISNFTLSPPSSPVSSPPPHRSARTMSRAIPQVPLDSEPEHIAPTPARRLFASQQALAIGMLPTPEETPRKRPLQTKTSLKKTARVLFPDRNATIEEATPRKARKTKNVFSLEDLDDNTAAQSSSKIPIFTDSNARIPTQDDGEDSPFIVKKSKAKATPQKPRQLDARSAHLQGAVDRDEGLLFYFRGRKMLRPFREADEAEDASDEDHSALPIDEKLLRHQIGHEATRPLTRSTFKPRRTLFQDEIKERDRKNGVTSDDEEADTEIETEAEAATPSRRKGKATVPIVPAVEATPPPTVRKPKREVSFEGWSRVKSAHHSGGSTPGGKKRVGEPLERDAADKRARSEHSTSSMSLDEF